MSNNSLPGTLNIGQDAQGIIGKTVIGATIIYGSVTYNTAPVKPDASIAQPQASVIGPNPYQGLLAFQENDGDRFFGRDQQIEDLWKRFQTLHEEDSVTRLLTLYGPSGSGKSSLARAGLIPALAQRPLSGQDCARVAVLVPGSHPLEALATILARIATNDPTPVTKTREFATELHQPNAKGIYDGLRRIADTLPDIATAPLIVLVDQLEEVFTLCEDPEACNAFIENLLCAAAERSKRVSVIVTVRSDFLGATQKYPHLNQLIASQGFFVAAMSVEGLREAITKPAELSGHPLDQSTVHLLIEQTDGHEGALPLLQFALTQIWAELAEGKDPAKTLERIGGVGGALAGEAQRIYKNLQTGEQEIARRVFLGLVQLGEGAKDTRRRTEVERIVSHRDSLTQVQKVIARFANPGARLITLADEGGIKTAEVTHEALFDHWQQMKTWLDGSRSDLRFQRRLDEAAILWQENKRPVGSLWRSPDLDFLRQYHRRASNDMTPLQLAFFQASEQSEIHQKWLRQLALRSLIALFIALIGLLISTFYQLQRVQRLRVEQLAAVAETLAEKQPVDALINAIAATGLSQSVLVQFPDRPSFASVDRSLLSVIPIHREQNQMRLENVVSSVAFSPNGQRIVSGSWDNTVRMWDANTGVPIGPPLTGHTDGIQWIAFSPDGQRIVSGSADKTIRIWDANTGDPIGSPLTGHEDAVFSVAFSSDGRRIVSGSVDKTVRLWNANTGAPIGDPLTGHGDVVFSVAFSADGQRIVSGSADNTLRLWDAKTGAPIGPPLTGHRDKIWLVAFSPNGQRVVSSSADKTVRLWDAKTGDPIGEPLEGHEDAVYSIAFSPNGQRIVSGSADNTLRLWDATTGKPIGKPLTGHEGRVYSVAFSPDGQHIVSGSRDYTVRIWDAKTRALEGHEGTVYSIAFSPDGQRIVSGSADQTVRLWNATTGDPIGPPFDRT